MEVEKVREILRTQFSEELTHKVGELDLIEERIQLARFMLHRLRLGILAQHYNVSSLCPPEDYSQENIGVQASWERFERAFLEAEGLAGGGGGGSEAAAACASDSSGAGPFAPPTDTRRSSSCPNACSQDHSDSESGGDSCGEEDVEEEEEEGVEERSADETESGSGGDLGNSRGRGCANATRFYSKKRLIVGNTSQFIDPKVRGSDGSTHKWMVYVRGPGGEADVSRFVKSVTFFLHPSYHPNDMVRVSRPPFHLTRLGWGEFPVRVQLEFLDGRNKPVDIIHNLALDRTHTGQQTLGAETVVELDIVSGHGPSTIGPPPLSLSLALPSPQLPPPPPVTQGLGCSANTPFTEVHIKQEMPPDAMETEPPLVRTVTLPCTLPSLKVLLDHDYCLPVVVLRAGCPTPPSEDPSSSSCLAQSGSSSQSSDPLDRHLHSIVQLFPLYGRASEDLPLAPASLEQFKAWSVGRRRGLEWLRAVAMRRQLRRRMGMAGSISMTTREVVDWCRTHGYTPLDPAIKDSPGFCKFCGWQLSAMDTLDPEPRVPANYHGSCRERLMLGDRGVKLSTFSTPFELFRELPQPWVKKAGDQFEVVDVESLGGGVGMECTLSPLDHHLPKFRVPQTPELKWVQQTASSIGISIYPAVIEKMYAHVVEHMIFMACSRLVKAILNEAVNETVYSGGGASSKERLLLPVHIFSALRKIELCDFLTNRHLGLLSQPP